MFNVCPITGDFGEPGEVTVKIRIAITCLLVTLPSNYFEESTMIQHRTYHHVHNMIPCLSMVVGLSVV